jgi:hypothetical protein
LNVFSKYKNVEVMHKGYRTYYGGRFDRDDFDKLLKGVQLFP